MLAPETLVWKLAGLITLAATGQGPGLDHTFTTDTLPALFEQLIVQLQDLPAPPPHYRVQVDEPALASDERVRLITGYSGAGKTSWVAQAAQHAAGPVVYVDIGDTPGATLSQTVARELAARLFGGAGGGLGGVLVPGASGREVLLGIGRQVREAGLSATLVLDNAHAVAADLLVAVVEACAPLNVILLCRPTAEVQAIEALGGVVRQELGGWSTDTIAAEVAERGCRVNAAEAQCLLDLTGGLPLYVQNALGIAKSQYDGAVGAFCQDLITTTHSVETAQEAILGRLFDDLPAGIAQAAMALSLSDIPLQRDEAVHYLQAAADQSSVTSAAAFRRLRATGILQVFGGDKLKIHDGARVVGKARLAAAGDEVLRRHRKALQTLVIEGLQRGWSYGKLRLFLRLTGELAEYAPLVAMASDEHFHELGLWSEIEPHIEAVAANEGLTPDMRVTALDGLVFADLKYGTPGKAGLRLDLMEALIRDHDLGGVERLRAVMKRMSLLAGVGDREGVRTAIKSVEADLDGLPDDHGRIFRYNAAVALYQLGDHKPAAEMLNEIVEEYYGVLGLTPQQVLGRNAPELRPLLKGDDQLDDIKHLGDSLDALAKASDALGRASPFARIHALKFYELARAHDSMLRVGQDLVDVLIGFKDYTGARQLMETTLLPQLRQLQLADYLIPIASQYAVVLAYCGAFADADREMARLAPFEAGLNATQRKELTDQRGLIEQLRRRPPPPQSQLPEHLIARAKAMLEGAEPPKRQGAPFPVRSEKVGRNDPCPCGSGAKSKKCCYR